MDKKELRRLMKSRLLEIDSQSRTDKSRLACKNLIESDFFNRGSVIMLYLSLPHEIDTTPAILYCWQKEKTVAVPKVSWQQRHMIPVEITSLDTGFAAEESRLRNPITGVPAPLEDIDLVITPGLAFDRSGCRLGRGGAYYDRFFSSSRLNAMRCGFAFDEQIIDEVPMEEHDKKVDMIITDKEIIQIK